MHGQHFNHANIAKRQGLGGLISGVIGGGNPSPTTTVQNSQNSPNNDPLGIGSIIGGVTSAILPPQSSESSSSSQTSTSLTSSTSSSSSSVSLTSTSSPTSSSSSTSSSSVSPSSVSSSISTSLSSSSSISPTTTSSISTPSDATPTPAPSNVASTATTFVSAPSSTSQAPVSKSFLENKPLEGGIFALVGLIVVALLILIGTIWIRLAKRRRLDREALDAAAFDPGNVDRYRDEESNSMEKLRRMDSTSSGGHTTTTAGQAGFGSGYGYGQGGYPVPPMPSRSPPQHAQGYGQPLPYQGLPPQGMTQGNEWLPYVPPRSPTKVYDPARKPGPTILPQLNTATATPNVDSLFEDPNSVAPSGQNKTTQRRGSMSLLNSPPISPSSAESGGEGGNIQRSGSHSKTLDPSMREMPVAPPLPAKFGSDDDDDDDAYDGIDGQDGPRALKVANQ